MAAVKAVSRANALAVQGYRHCCHVMLHSPVGDNCKVFGFYPVRHAVLMQVRFDGYFGFPGGFVDDGETLEEAINREVQEELGTTSSPVNITKSDYIACHLYEEYVKELKQDKKLCLHFFAKRIPLEQFLELEKRQDGAPFLGYEVLGTVRCPLYTLRDKQGGLPAFLQHNFVGNARQQLLIGLEHEQLLSADEIKEAMSHSELEDPSGSKL